MRGREWKSPKGETRYFNSLEVWSIERAGDEQEKSAGGGGKSAGGGPASRSGRSEVEPPPHTDEDEIPF